MKILVDTCIWSLSLRRKNVMEEPYIHELHKLIEEYRVQMIGPIRQEILSGIRDPEQVQKLQEHLRAFTDLSLVETDYERAAEFFSTCRQQGVQGSNTDFLICAVGAGRQMPIFTFDDDFKRFETCLPIQLHQARQAREFG